MSQLISIVLELLLGEVFFGSGKSNPCLRIEILQDNPKQLKSGLLFEVENVGEKSTCLYPEIQMAFITPEGERRNIVFDVDDSDLSLHSFTPRRFTASARNLQLERGYGHDKRYCFDYGEGAAIQIDFDDS